MTDDYEIPCKTILDMRNIEFITKNSFLHKDYFILNSSLTKNPPFYLLNNLPFHFFTKKYPSLRNQHEILLLCLY